MVCVQSSNYKYTSLTSSYLDSHHSDKRFRFDKMAIEITKWFTSINLGTGHKVQGGWAMKIFKYWFSMAHPRVI